MSGWSQIKGRAMALDARNVDTDQLIPARFMSQPRDQGYGGFLLHDVRSDDAGHVLNRYAPQVLITRENFGSGSSREAAVYALVDFGIKAVFAPSFGDIFSSNAVNNGLLPARLTEAEIDALIDTLGGDDAAAFVDLEKGEAEIAGTKLRFSVDPVWQQKLINGWDDIDMTAQYAAQITEFRGKRLAAYPWAMPTTD